LNASHTPLIPGLLQALQTSILVEPTKVSTSSRKVSNGELQAPPLFIPPPPPPFYNNLEPALLLLLACTHDKNDDNEEEVRNTPLLLS